MGPLVSMDVSTSGLTAYREMMDVVASNIANMYSTTTPAGTPYQEEAVVLQAGPTFAATLGQVLQPQGVEVSAIVQLTQAGPGAGATAATAGQATNVDLVAQMTQLIMASRAYDANAAAFALEKSVEQRALQLGQNA